MATPYIDPLLASGSEYGYDGYEEDGASVAGGSNKRGLMESESPDAGPSAAKKAKTGKASKGEPKKRGSKACLACRKLKMRCIFEEGSPCKRCQNQGSECVFEASQRGKRKGMKAANQANMAVKHMEETIETILKAMLTSDPNLLAKACAQIKPDADNTESLRNLLYSSFASPTAVPLTSSSLASSSLQDTKGKKTSSYGASTSGGSGEPQSPRLDALPSNDLSALGLLADASLRNTQRTADLRELLNREIGHVPADEPFTETRVAPPGTKLGPASAEFFRPGAISDLSIRKHLIEQRMMPTILLNHVISPAEAIELFDLFFDRCAIHNGLLSVEFHTPQLVASRSPFLFTCICAVASKFYTKKPELYPKIMSAAHELGVGTLRSSYKSVEVIQGFLLLSTWSQPSLRYEEDRSWMYSGIAIRMGQELGLFRKREAVVPDDVDDATRLQFQRETLNRERTWLYTFVVDRSMAAQCGRSYTLREDFIVRSCETWWQQEGTMTRDVSLCAMVAFHRQHGRALDLIYSATDSTNALNRRLDYKLLYKTFTDQMRAFGEIWNPRTAINTYNAIAGRFYFAYYELGLGAYCLQLAMENNVSEDIAQMTQACYRAASEVCITFSGTFASSGTLQTSTDNILVFSSYSCCFLLKLLNSPVSPPDATEVFASVEAVVRTLEAVAVDQTHQHFLYAAFLKVLVNAKRKELGMEEAIPMAMPDPGIPPPAHFLDQVHNPHLEALFQGSFWDDMSLFGANLAGADAPSVGGNSWEEFLVYSRPPSPKNDFQYFAAHNGYEGL